MNDDAECLACLKRICTKENSWEKANLVLSRKVAVNVVHVYV